MVSEFFGCFAARQTILSLLILWVWIPAAFPNAAPEKIDALAVRGFVARLSRDGLGKSSIARKLAAEHRVHAIARFGAPGSMERLRDAGIECIRLDFTRDDLGALDSDYDYVLHFATYQVPGSEDFDEAIVDKLRALGYFD